MSRGHGQAMMELTVWSGARGAVTKHCDPTWRSSAAQKLLNPLPVQQISQLLSLSCQAGLWHKSLFPFYREAKLSLRSQVLTAN